MPMMTAEWDPEVNEPSWADQTIEVLARIKTQDSNSWEIVNVSDSNEDEDEYNEEAAEADMDLVDSDSDSDSFLHVELDLPRSLWLNPGLILYPGARDVDWQDFEQGEEEEGTASKPLRSILKEDWTDCRERRHLHVRFREWIEKLTIEPEGLGYRIKHHDDPDRKARKQRVFYAEDRKNLGHNFPIDLPENEQLWDQLRTTPTLRRPSRRNKPKKPVFHPS